MVLMEGGGIVANLLATQFLSSTVAAVRLMACGAPRHGGAFVMADSASYSSIGMNQR